MESVNSNFFSFIEKSSHPLIVIPLNPSIDHISSAFAISQIIEKSKKKSTIFCQEEIPQKLSFLKKPSSIINSLDGSRDFLLIFNTEKNKILEINTKESKKEYIIKITPEKGSINPKDFSFIPASFKYDLVITIGVKNPESLEKLYIENNDLFFEIPKINIDCLNSNDNYGQLNIINPTASSCAEIIAEILLENNEKEMDKEIAQTLLTGIIASTESFQKSTTSPKSMILAAKLMKYEANQSVIIRHLYKTKPLSFMKLWGKVMSRLNWSEKYQMSWSLISGEDFAQSHASESDLPLILEEIQKNFSQGKIFAILYSYGTPQIKIQLNILDQKLKQKIIETFEIKSENSENGIISFNSNSQDLIEAEKEFLKKIKESEEIILPSII